MAVTSYPGVYVEEVSSGVRPIAAASTSTPAFVGLAEMGPADRAVRITSWTGFQRYYGSFINDGYLAHSVLQFFNNGGSQCYIVRVVRDDAAAASVTVVNRAGVPVAGLTFSARSKGAWGNYLYLQIEDGTVDPMNEFRLSIRRQDEADVVPADFADIPTLEVHDNLSMDPNATNYVETMLAKNSKIIDAKVLAGNIVMQRGVHRGGPSPVAPPITNLKFQINIDYDGFQEVTMTGITPASTLAEIAAEITTRVRALTKKKTSTSDDAFDEFECTVDTGKLLMQSGTNKPTFATNTRSSVRIQNASTANAAGFLKIGEGNGGTSQDALAPRRPAAAAAVQIGDAAIATPVTAAVLGTDGVAALSVTDFSDSFALLDSITDVSLLAVPGENTTTMVDAGMAYCKNRQLSDMFYIGEMTRDDDEPDEAEAFRKSLTTPNSYGAVYYPWVMGLDPSGRTTEPIALPPSGYIAGLYARTDSRRGVWKAPAGTEASLNGVVALATNLTDVEQGNLNRLNVNCLRRFPASGIVSFGARTITSDTEYNYVPVRRTAIMLRVSMYNGLQWAVFEPNDESLWSQIRLNLNSFMMTLFRQGAFQGSTPSQAFFVKCDGETTTQDDINLGIVNVQVGFAPLRPAEFIVVKISQKAGQST